MAGRGRPPAAPPRPRSAVAAPPRGRSASLGGAGVTAPPPGLPRRSASPLQPGSAQRAQHATRPQSAQGDRPRFSIGDRGSYRWEEIPVFPTTRSIFSKRVQPEDEPEPDAFSYRAALGGFGVKPGSLGSAMGAQDSFASEITSDAGSIFSEEEGRRRARTQKVSELTTLLPGYEDAGNPREKAHLRRMITSADNLFPVRNSLKVLGVESINGLVYDESDPSKLISQLSADIYTGMWSCCRRTNPGAPGCSAGEHSTTKFLCTRCGVIFDKTALQKTPECSYHPGAINRSKAGGVWWTCCGAVGFKNSLLHSVGGDLNGPQEWKWGCKRDREHVPLSTFDESTNPAKYEHCTIGSLTKHVVEGPQPEAAHSYDDSDWVGSAESVTCNRISAITCVAQPLMPVILGIQLQYEVVTDLEVIDGNRYVGNPGPISDRDHLRKIREEKLIFEDGEYIVELQMEYNDRNIQTLTVKTNTGRSHTFFEQWKIDNDEKSLKEMQAGEDMETQVGHLKAPEGHRVVGLRYGIDDCLKCLGIMTQRRANSMVTKDKTIKDIPTVARCTLCAAFYIPQDAKDKDSGQGAMPSTCKFHSGFWTPQRRVRLADCSTMKKCGAMCEARSCGKPCKKFEHRTHVLVHSCGDNKCSERCDMDGCVRRCSMRDHFHGTNDPMAIHSCGGSHPCRTPCVCGKKCKFVAARGEAVHTWHWCGGIEGCSKTCQVAECTARCVHPNHHHHLEEDRFHHCGDEHPCLETCSAEGCISKCMLDREHAHKHACHNPHKLGCRCQCSIFDCMEFCSDPDHFHADHSDFHKCGDSHPCRRLCNAPGCKSACSLSREKAHERHECRGWDKLRCVEKCGVKGCIRPCSNTDHFHGLDLVEDDGVMVPKIPHLCNGRHACGKKCTAPGCFANCTVDKAVKNHVCLCDGISGCRLPCWFSTQAVKCRNFCSSKDHSHAAEIHLCPKDHHCKELCGSKEPCLWDGGTSSVLRRQRKTCMVMIPAGKTIHDGPHDCCGKHARPVEFKDTDDADTRCTIRCDKSGCRRRCRFPPGDADHELRVEGHVVHMCEEMMCLEMCPYPKCKRVCNLDHEHTVTDELSRCGCCDAHRAWVPPKKDNAEAFEEEAGSGIELATSAAGSARATKLLAQMKLAKEIGAAKQKGRHHLHTRRAQGH